MADRRVFLDTAFIQALLNRRDQYHDQAKAWLPRVREAGEVWVTEAILVEVGNHAVIGLPEAIEVNQIAPSWPQPPEKQQTGYDDLLSKPTAGYSRERRTMAKRKKMPGRRRRGRRNPRTFAPRGQGRAPTAKELVATVHEALLEARETFESPETEARLGVPLNAYFLRVVATLEEQLKIALVFPEELVLFARAAGTFLPVLTMKWLPEDPRSFTRKLTAEEQEFLEKLGGNRGQGLPDQPRGRWSGLMDLITESATVFTRFGYTEGLVQMFALNEALIARIGEVHPEVLEK